MKPTGAPPDRRRRAGLRRKLGKLFTYLMLIAIALTTALPFAWMFITSLHPPMAEAPTMATLLRPPTWHPGNYSYVFYFPELPVGRFIVNSFVVTGGVVLFQLTLCSLAAFAFSRLHWRGRDSLFFLFILTMMIPGQVLVVPLFMIVERLGWINTYWGLIIPAQYLSTAFGTFLLRQFFITIPPALDEAARLDGCSELGVLWHVILPAAKPALATVAAFAFIWTWTDFYWALIATHSRNMRTLEVGLSVFNESFSGTRYPLRMAAAVIVLVPVMAVFLLLQRYFVRGVVMSGVKG
jgi:multiple sugar transport system permease protein